VPVALCHPGVSSLNDLSNVELAALAGDAV
jgi:hypothetical protein